MYNSGLVIVATNNFCVLKVSAEETKPISLDDLKAKVPPEKQGNCFQVNTNLLFACVCIGDQINNHFTKY